MLTTQPDTARCWFNCQNERNKKEIVLLKKQIFSSCKKLSAIANGVYWSLAEKPAEDILQDLNQATEMLDTVADSFNRLLRLKCEDCEQRNWKFDFEK